MNKEKICRITASHFPGYTGIILTGSQAERGDLYAGADIDLVVFHPDYSSLFNSKIREGGYQLDYTLAPLFDVANTIYDQSYDLNGTFLSMVATGEILADTHDIVRQIRQYVVGIYNRMGNNTRNEYIRLLQELERMNRLFAKPLKEHEKVFLVCEFVSTVVAIETIRIRQWRPTIKHRARILYDSNKPLTEELVAIVHAAIEKDKFGNLDAFLTRYRLLHEPGMGLPILASGVIITELALKDFTLRGFADRVLPLIEANAQLKSSYRYYYSSPKQYWPAYRHDICVLFETVDAGTAMETADELQRLLTAADIGLQEMSVLFPREDVVNSALDHAIRELDIVLCEWHTQLLQYAAAWEDRGLLALRLCSWLMLQLGLSVADTARANLYLSQRWLISRREHKLLATFEELNEYRVEKYRLLQAGYKKNRTLIRAAAEAGTTPPPAAVLTTPLPAVVLATLERLLAERQQYASAMPFQQGILGLLQIAQPDIAFLYITLAEEIVQQLNLGTEQKLRCFYYLNEAIAGR